MNDEKNTNTFQFIKEEEKPKEKENKENVINPNIKEDFVTGLPDWDLAPLYEVIRRVKR